MVQKITATAVFYFYIYFCALVSLPLSQVCWSFFSSNSIVYIVLLYCNNNKKYRVQKYKKRISLKTFLYFLLVTIIIIIIITTLLVNTSLSTRSIPLCNHAANMLDLQVYIEKKVYLQSNNNATTSVLER